MNLPGQKDYTIEQVKALYFDATALIEPPYQLYRMDGRGDFRYYYEIVDGKPVLYPSVTSFLSATTPAGPGLQKWYADMGWHRANDYKEERANYGSLMHSAIQYLGMTGTFDLENADQFMREYLQRRFLKESYVDMWIEEFKKDVLSFAQFMIDYNIRIIAIENTLRSKKHRIAGTLDIACEMNKLNYTDKTPLDKRERINAIIDMKGGKKGFYKSHAYQLHAYKEMFEENYPMTIHKVFNWAGSDWRKKPNYKLCDQTDQIGEGSVGALINLFYSEYNTGPSGILLMGGQIDIKQGIDANYREVGVEEYLIDNPKS